MNFKYFSLENDERLFICSDTGESGVEIKSFMDFVAELDELRASCGFPFIINSGYRSPRARIEAKKDRPGEHTRGAADIRCIGGNRRRTIIAQALRLNFDGIGIAKEFVHVDKRITTPVVWTY